MASSPRFFLQNSQHLGRNIHDCDVVSSGKHFHRQVAGTSAAVQAMRRPPKRCKPGVNGFHVLVADLLKVRLKSATFVLLVLRSALTVTVLVRRDDSGLVCICDGRIPDFSTRFRRKRAWMCQE